MKKIKLLLITAIVALVGTQAFAQKGIGTNLPDRSSVLELQAGNRGLLIPRIDIPDLEAEAPVNNPAQSLLVYNTGTTTTEGYYYWDTNHWVPFLTNANLTEQLEEGERITIVGNEISIDLSDADGNGNQVLVTVDDGSGNISTEWLDINSLLNNLQAGNGITIDTTDADNPIIELGGELTHETIINTDGNNFEIQSGGDSFLISGLTNVTIDSDGNLIEAGTGDPVADPKDTDFQVMIVGDEGLVQKVSVGDLVQQVVGAQNGLTWNDTENKVELGGNLTRDTQIDLEENDLTFVTDGDEGRLMVEGLIDTEDAGQKNLVVDTDGTIRSQTRVLNDNITDSYTIETDLSDYSAFVQEIFLVAATGNSDYTVTLPTVDANNAGQIVNIKVSNPSIDDDAGYVMIDDGSGTVVEGYINGKSWVFKSNGVSWLLISDN